MNKFTESAKQFTMDGGLSLYDFKEEVGGPGGGLRGGVCGVLGRSRGHMG
jgi:hypothetical protein